jgi:hypothetical protein
MKLNYSARHIIQEKARPHILPNKMVTEKAADLAEIQGSAVVRVFIERKGFDTETSHILVIDLLPVDSFDHLIGQIHVVQSGLDPQASVRATLQVNHVDLIEAKLGALLWSRGRCRLQILRRRQWLIIGLVRSVEQMLQTKVQKTLHGSVL